MKNKLEKGSIVVLSDESEENIYIGIFNGMVSDKYCLMNPQRSDKKEFVAIDKHEILLSKDEYILVAEAKFKDKEEELED